MGSSGDKINSSVPTKNMVKQLTTNVAAGAIGVMYITAALLDEPSRCRVEETELFARPTLKSRSNRGSASGSTAQGRRAPATPTVTPAPARRRALRTILSKL